MLKKTPKYVQHCFRKIPYFGACYPTACLTAAVSEGSRPLTPLGPGLGWPHSTGLAAAAVACEGPWGRGGRDGG